MTPARKAALQWYHDNPEARLLDHPDDTARPSRMMAARMAKAGEIAMVKEPEWFSDSWAENADYGPHSLTDLGRQRLFKSDDWKVYKDYWPNGRVYWTVENRKKNEIRIGVNGGVTRYHDHGQAKDEAERLNGNAPDGDVLDRADVVTA